MLITLVMTTVLVVMAVLVHYEALLRLMALMRLLRIRPRTRIAVGVLGALAAHVIEIFIFALGYYLLIHVQRVGELTGSLTEPWRDCVYFSFSVYSSLGFGDIIATGPLRFLTGMEVLTGLVLIAWTASFMYVEMQRLWARE